MLTRFKTSMSRTTDMPSVMAASPIQKTTPETAKAPDEIWKEKATSVHFITAKVTAGALPRLPLFQTSFRKLSDQLFGALITRCIDVS
jgi:hypothetical protein